MEDFDRRHLEDKIEEIERSIHRLTWRLNNPPLYKKGEVHGDWIITGEDVSMDYPICRRSYHLTNIKTGDVKNVDEGSLKTFTNDG